jgi:peptide/nickel transport system permease protein
MASQAPLTSSPATAAPVREPGGAAAVQQRLSNGIALFRRGGALRKPVSIISWGFVALILLVAILAPLLAPADPNVQSRTDELLAIGTPGHLLGTDALGRDQLSRLIYGARPLVLVSLLSVVLAAAIGTLIGLIAGYFRGLTETVLMRLMDALLSFPLILLAIMIVSALGASAGNLILAIAIAQVPIFARIVTALTARESAREYILAARSAGFSTRRILGRELLPNVSGAIFVQGTSLVAVAGGYAGALSYLGLGIRPPTADWGYMVRENQEFLSIAPDLSILPGLLLTLFLTAVNFIGDDLDALLGRDRQG